MHKFRFGCLDGSTFGVLSLLADGSIRDGTSANEQSWSVDDGFLHFRDAAGRITTSFNQVVSDGLSRSWIGPFFPRGPAPWHTLSEFREPARIHAELLAALYGGDNPLAYADAALIDEGYPHTNLQADLVEDILHVVQPTFWLEFGAMLGGSAIRAADAVKRLGLQTDIVCVDPFTGDVNMWDWEQRQARLGEWRFLRLERGRPTIYDRFLANVAAAAHQDIILPIPATTIVGAKLLRRLYEQRRVSSLPDVIYLDSAHEPGETLLELGTAWGVLKPGGLLVGDDWSWQAVRTDVARFAAGVRIDGDTVKRLTDRRQSCAVQGNVLLMGGGQWAIAK